MTATGQKQNPTKIISILDNINSFSSNINSFRNSLTNFSSKKNIRKSNNNSNSISVNFPNDYYNSQDKNEENSENNQPEIDLALLKDCQKIKNFPSSKTSYKPFGIVKAYAANTSNGISRSYNEDRVSIIINMLEPQGYISSLPFPRVSFFGIFDGHSGKKCAEFLRDNLHNYICSNSNFPFNIPLAIKEGFINADRDYLTKFNKIGNKFIDNSGSCALVLLVVENKIYVINLGDSRCLISMKNGQIQKDVTIDHKPNFPNEKARIYLNGGKIYRTKNNINNINDSTVSLGPFRVLPGKLSVSRTIGDSAAKIKELGGNPKVIISEPEIFEYDYLSDDIDFFILGCDGIFEQMKSKDVLKCAWLNIENNNKILMEEKNNNYYSNKKEINNSINMNSTCENIADFILKSAMLRKSFDNVTCIIVALKNLLVNNNTQNFYNNYIMTGFNNLRKNISNASPSINNKINYYKVSPMKSKYLKKINNNKDWTQLEPDYYQLETEFYKNNSSKNFIHNNNNVSNNKYIRATKDIQISNRENSREENENNENEKLKFISIKTNFSCDQKTKRGKKIISRNSRKNNNKTQFNSENEKTPSKQIKYISVYTRKFRIIGDDYGFKNNYNTTTTFDNNPNMTEFTENKNTFRKEKNIINNFTLDEGYNQRIMITKRNVKSSLDIKNNNIENNINMSNKCNENYKKKRIFSYNKENSKDDINQKDIHISTLFNGIEELKIDFSKPIASTERVYFKKIPLENFKNSNNYNKKSKEGIETVTEYNNKTIIKNYNNKSQNRIKDLKNKANLKYIKINLNNNGMKDYGLSLLNPVVNISNFLHPNININTLKDKC